MSLVKVLPLTPGDIIEADTQNDFLESVENQFGFDDLDPVNVKYGSINKIHITSSNFSTSFIGRVSADSSTPFTMTDSTQTLQVDSIDALIDFNGLEIQSGDCIRLRCSFLTGAPTYSQIDQDEYFAVFRMNRTTGPDNNVGPVWVYSMAAYNDAATPAASPSYISYTAVSMAYDYVHSGSSINIDDIHIEVATRHSASTIPVTRFHFTAIVEKL